MYFENALSNGELPVFFDARAMIPRLRSPISVVNTISEVNSVLRVLQNTI